MMYTKFLEIYMHCDGLERIKKMGLLDIKSRERDK